MSSPNKRRKRGDSGTIEEPKSQASATATVKEETQGPEPITPDSKGGSKDAAEANVAVHNEDDRKPEPREQLSAAAKVEEMQTRNSNPGIKQEYDHHPDEPEASTTKVDESAANLEEYESDRDEEDLPTSIEGIIRYMDSIEPGQKYFRRQADSRNGCSKTRKKLRRHAKQFPDDPAVSFYVSTQKWAPPDRDSLDAIVELLKDIIN